MRPKRKLLEGLMEDADAMQQRRETNDHDLVSRQARSALQANADQIGQTREPMHVYRAVLARRVRVSTRTGSKVERGPMPGPLH